MWRTTHTSPNCILFEPEDVSSIFVPAESSQIKLTCMANPSAFTFNVSGTVFFFTLHTTLKLTSFWAVGVKRNTIDSLYMKKILLEMWIYLLPSLPILTRKHNNYTQQHVLFLKTCIKTSSFESEWWKEISPCS